MSHPGTRGPGTTAECRRSLKNLPAPQGGGGCTDESHQRWAATGSQPPLENMHRTTQCQQLLATHCHQLYTTILTMNIKKKNYLQPQPPAGKEWSRCCIWATLTASTLCRCWPACRKGTWCGGGRADVTAGSNTRQREGGGRWAHLKTSMVLHR